MSSAVDPIVFARLHPPRPLDPKVVEAWLLRLAADPSSSVIALEVRATAEGTSYWLGTTGEHLRWLRRTLANLLPGMVIENSPATPRLPSTAAGKVRLRPRGLPLIMDEPARVTRSLLSALNTGLADGEHMVLQILLGPRRQGRHPHAKVADPLQPIWSTALWGNREAATPVRKQLAARQIQPGFATCIRFGVHADTSERRGRLLAGLLGGIRTARTPGIHIDLVKDKPIALDQARPPVRWDMAPGASELVGLLAWPLGRDDLPGLPPMHPRTLLASRTLSETVRTFGTSTVPGDPRPIGVSPEDSLFHLIAIGPTGSGKSTALLNLIHADITARRPVLVVDPKRQLVDDIVDSAIGESRIDDVVILDPADPACPGFNPLDVGHRDPDVVVDGLVAVFAAVFKDGWGPRTQDIVNSGLLALARVGAMRAEPFTLLDLPRLFTDPGFRRSVIGHVATDPGLGQFWAWYESLSAGAQAAAIAAPLNKIRQYLLRPSLRRILGQAAPTFRLRDVFRGNKIVLVPLNEALVGPLTAQLLGSLIVAETWSATLERASERSPMKRPASVWIDEVQNYLHLPTSLGDALNASRSMGVSWSLAHQFRAQLPPAMRAAVDSNARNKIVFRPNDPDDARDAARQAPGLEAIDFLSLPKYTAYATIVAAGESQPWCSVATLPPPASSGFGDQIRTASRDTYGATHTTEPITNNAPVSPPVVGRKQRRPST